MRINVQSDSDRAAALAWLARQLRWEQTLERLRSAVPHGADVVTHADHHPAEAVRPESAVPVADAA